MIYYHFKIQCEGMSFRLRALGNDDDALNLEKYMGDNKVIKVYTEHRSKH